MPWTAAVCAAVSMIAASQQARNVYVPPSPEPEPEPTPMDCTGCGAPLRCHKCDYCRKEYPMFGWFKRTPKETPAQVRQRLADAHMAKFAAQRLYGPRSPSPSTRSAPSPAPAPDTSSPFLYGVAGYVLGSSSHSSGASSTEAPASAPVFSSGGGGDYSGAGASGSWESSSSCSSSSSSYDSGSSSSSSSDSGSCSSSGSSE